MNGGEGSGSPHLSGVYMANFKFTGDPNAEDAREGVEVFGYKFSRKAYTDVTERAIVAKLRGNGHFTEKKATRASKPKAD
jgi:hypothetical protein